MSNLGKPIIDVSADHVVIMGTRIPRPPTIAPSQWLAFWERAAGTATQEAGDQAEQDRRGVSDACWCDCIAGESGQAVDAEDALG